MRRAIRLLLGMLMLIGAASARADLVPSPGQVDFGYQTLNTTSAPRATTFMNTGSEAVTVVAVAPASGVYARTGGSCGTTPFTIAAQASCTLEHTFRPTALTSYPQTLTVTPAGGASVNFGLYGQGEVGYLEIDPSTLFFPSTPIGASSERTTNLYNARPVPLLVTQITPTTGSAFVRTGGGCPEPPMTFGAYTGCTLKYSFVPTQVGPSDLTLTILSTTGTFILNLDGNGLPEIPLFEDGFE